MSHPALDPVAEPPRRLREIESEITELARISTRLRTACLNWSASSTSAKGGAGRV